jgi:hypothetical protein
LFQLQPVTFAYKDDTHGATHYGLIAEEVAAVYPELVTRTAAGEVQTVKYQELIPMLLNELRHERQDRQDEVAALRQELAALRALVGQGRRAEAAIPSATVAASGMDSSPR